MEKLPLPLHGAESIPNDGWQVWSHVLRFPVRCQCAKDAKRILKALEALYSHGAPVDYQIVEDAIAEEDVVAIAGERNGN